jgi:hypothetical protein
MPLVAGVIITVVSVTVVVAIVGYVVDRSTARQERGK